eukprot:TRINITY_DN3481_c1_g1_i2.p1 TRINITY_DN3481_c1_g1~~TRINITY_DN3481_c1_g1_i2.p1  ORF type:complete len:260 (+),score=37.76 TRINITY_DN3481_c1_g1_i2:89-868(+)
MGSCAAVPTEQQPPAPRGSGGPAAAPALRSCQPRPQRRRCVRFAGHAVEQEPFHPPADCAGSPPPAQPRRPPHPDPPPPPPPAPPPPPQQQHQQQQRGGHKPVPPTVRSGDMQHLAPPADSAAQPPPVTDSEAARSICTTQSGNIAVVSWATDSALTSLSDPEPPEVPSSCPLTPAESAACLSQGRQRVPVYGWAEGSPAAEPAPPPAARYRASSGVPGERRNNNGALARGPLNAAYCPAVGRGGLAFIGSYHTRPIAG